MQMQFIPSACVFFNLMLMLFKVGKGAVLHFSPQMQRYGVLCLETICGNLLHMHICKIHQCAMLTMSLEYGQCTCAFFTSMLGCTALKASPPTNPVVNDH